ncbi:MAG: M23 family metallopeptidase [Bacteroidia bacterium]
MERFKNDTYVHVQLPFYSEWSVSQGHAGKITHKDDWQYAWDFVVTDEDKHTFRFPGKQLSDFYCYNLPVLAPAEGVVVTLLDDVDDNAVGNVNLSDNWGNTIIIRHTELLYSKISHIKKGSFKVKVGDRVKKGEVIALCGNSGRSPEPHVHFQLQASAFIGAKTLKYPISYFISKKEGKPKLHSFSYPEEGDIIYRPTPTALLYEAFHLVPGMKMKFNVTGDANYTAQTWEVFTDAYNHTYLYCHTTKSIAYFTNNDTLFYFTSFTGDKESLLYYFYLAAYKVILSYVPGLEITDKLLINGNYRGPVKFMQDLIAPFHIFMKPLYRFSFAGTDNVHHPASLTIKSSAAMGNGSDVDFSIELSENKIKHFEITKDQTCIKAEHI